MEAGVYHAGPGRKLQPVYIQFTLLLFIQSSRVLLCERILVIPAGINCPQENNQ